MVKITRRIASVMKKKLVRFGALAKVVANITLHRNRSPANIRRLSLKTHWNESISGRSLQISQGTLSS